MATRIIRMLQQLLDVDAAGLANGDVPTYDATAGKFTMQTAAAGATPTLADVLAQGADAGGAAITGLADPTGNQDADTKAARSAAITSLSGVYQPLNSDLTAISALATTTFGRALLALADAAALRTVAGLGTAATSDTTAFDAAGAAASAQSTAEAYTDSSLAALSSVYQPLDSDLSSISALATTSYGRALLTLANAAAADWIPTTYLDTDVTLAADSDSKLATQAATKAYVDANAGGGDTLNTVAASGTSLTVDYATADVWDVTLTGNCTLTLTGFTDGDPDFLTLILRQDATGSRTVTWPTITWIGSGIAPTLHTAASSVDSVVLFSLDGGTTVYGVAQTSASGLRSGTSFPGSPSDGDLFYRTDRNILYFYKSSVTKWLSVNRNKQTFGVGGSVLWHVTFAGHIGYLPVFEDTYIEEFALLVLVSGTNNGSNYWNFTLNSLSGAGTGAAITSLGSSADTSNTWNTHTSSVGSVFDAATYRAVYVDSAAVGSPGGFYTVAINIVTRSVG